jgi:hypothetical protein
LNNEKEKNNNNQDLQTEPEKVEMAVDELFPPEIEEILKTAPPQVRKAIIEMGKLSLTRTMQPQVHPLFHKFSSQHIDKFLDYSHQTDENSYELARSIRWFHLAYVLGALSFLVFLVAFLARDNVALLSDILKLLVVFAGGFGSGFGLKTYLEKKK